MRKQTKEARGFRRAHAVPAVVAGHHVSAVSATCSVAHAALRTWVQRFAQEGPQGWRERPRSRATAHSHGRAGTTPQSPGRARPPPAWRPFFPGEWPRTCYRARPTDRSPAGSRTRPRSLKKNTRSSGRPTGRRTPTPAERASGSLARAALESRARRGERIVLYAAETLGGRFALPRLGWWRRAQRYRRPTRPLSQGQITQHES